MLQQMRNNAKWIWLVIVVAFVGGFLLYQTSGLAGRAAITPSTAVATVNGTEIGYLTWQNTAAQLEQQQEEQIGRGLTLDERAQLETQAFNNLVSDVLLQQEYSRRGISVTDVEIINAAKSQPPQQYLTLPELQTDGRFDMSKYQRFLASPTARQQGLLAGLEAFYRSEIPKQKLFNEIAGDIFPPDTRLWTVYRDSHDSATISAVNFTPTVTKEMKDAVTDAEMQKYYDAHAKDFDRTGHASLSIVEIGRRPTAVDTAATLKTVQGLRAEIEKGAKFEDVAKRESDDTVSGREGGKLGMAGKGRYVPEFEAAAAKLKVGEISGPVLTQFGYHLIRLDERKGDSLALHHILKVIKQGDSSAMVSDKRADTLAKIAASATEPAKFDSAAKKLALLVSRVAVDEGSPAIYLGQVVPSASAWAFSGAKVGESSDLFDDDRGYYLVRLDSLTQGGPQPLALVKDEVRALVAHDKAVDALMPKAKSFAGAAAASSLEAAAKAQGLKVEKVGPFAPNTQAPQPGMQGEVIGATFAKTLPVGAVSAPIKTDESVFVIRVDKRTTADSTKWLSQKLTQRENLLQVLRDQKIRLYLDALKKAAKIDDKRKALQAAQRRASS
ncbi:MAG TPA: peptidyl-prolyl cis-trans isomerase [Gemmatimonadaceae bacterium]